MRRDGHVHTGRAQLRDIRDHDEGPGEVAAVSSLSHLHRLGPQHNLQGAWDGTAGELGLRLLDSHLNTQKADLKNPPVPSVVLLLQAKHVRTAATFWKSMNLDLCVSRWKRERLLQTGFLQMVGGEYLNCWGTSLIMAWQSMHWKVPLTCQHGGTLVKHWILKHLNKHRFD